MKKSTVFWLSTALLFLGVIAGFLISPVKGGMIFGDDNKIDIQK